MVFCFLNSPHGFVSEAATVTLAWDPSDITVSGYKIHYGATSHNYQYQVDVKNSTSCTISGLEKGTTYYFAATAYNSNGESDFSEEVAYTVPQAFSSPPVDTDGEGISDQESSYLVIEAEEMSDHTGGGGQKEDYWVLWTNGSINEDVPFPHSTTYRFEVTAKGSLAHGVGPEMELLIDGQSKGTVFVNTGIPKTYIFQAEVSAGNHDVTIAFDNDYYNASQRVDRNLFVDKIAIVASPGDVVTELTIEAEHMTFHSSGTQKGDYWLLWTNGVMAEDVYFPNSGTYRIEVTAKGSLVDGVGPEMELLIDGQSKGSVFVNSENNQTYVFQAEISPGNHDFTLAFKNDYYNATQSVDRNLYIDEIMIKHLSSY
jgi:hypothetical protein